MNASAANGWLDGIFFLSCLRTARSAPIWTVSLVFCLCWAGMGLAGDLNLPLVSVPGHPGWKEKSFAGHTVYTPIQVDGHAMLQAQSNGTASGLFYETEIDLRRTPWLNWSWRAGNLLHDVDERTKSGDDYPARVYVVVKGGMAFWKTRALSYVWSSTQLQGTHWASAFTGNAHMIALRDARSALGAVVREKRNIVEDWKMAFGDDISRIDGVAIMTDTDNSGQSATAWFGDPWFSEN